jgi:hypothetical protein
MSASFYKLKDDTWGVRIKDFEGEANMEVEVTTKAGETKTVSLAAVSPSLTTQNYGHSQVKAPSMSAKLNPPTTNGQYQHNYLTIRLRYQKNRSNLLIKGE